MPLRAIGRVHIAPPCGDFLALFAQMTALRAQQQKVVTGTKARVFQHALNLARQTALQAWLHAPNIAHIADKAFGHGDLLFVLIDHFAHCQVQRNHHRIVHLMHQPAFFHLQPHQRGK